MYNKNLSWINDSEFIKAWDEFPARRSSEIHDRRFSLYYLAKSIREIAGDTVECGVFEGASSFIILKSIEQKSKIHHIFDSFEGLSGLNEQDSVKNERTFKWKKSDLSVPEDVVRGNLYKYNNVRYYKGWIPEKFNEVMDKKFSLVHIDVDLFQPTYDSVDFFYERMTAGGIIVCDDYGFESCPGAHKAMDLYFKKKPEKVIHLTTGQGIVIKQP